MIQDKYNARPNATAFAELIPSWIKLVEPAHTLDDPPSRFAFGFGTRAFGTVVVVTHDSISWSHCCEGRQIGPLERCVFDGTSIPEALIEKLRAHASMDHGDKP